MHPRKKLDISWADLAAAALSTARPPSRQASLDRLAALWAGPDHTFACLSVRTGFDLLLTALALPAGAEVLVSAITIPHMIQLLEHHGLVPVPVDLDLQHLELRRDRLQAALTDRTRAILVAHIFGTRMTLDPAADLAREHGLILIEDCAQAWVGGDFRGSPQADVSMFSFGTIKTATALGGALFTVRDPDLCRHLRALDALAPPRPERAFARRLLKNAALKALSDSPTLYGAFMAAIRAAGKDPDQVIMNASRGFSGPDLLALIRLRPERSLLALLIRRLEAGAAHSVPRRADRGERLLAMLPPGLDVPGRAAALRTWWLFPLIVPDGDRLRRELADAGFDATLASTSLTWVAPPDHMPWTAPTAARAAMERILYLPLSPDMPDDALKTMAALINRAAAAPHAPLEAHRDVDARPDPRPRSQRAPSAA